MDRRVRSNEHGFTLIETLFAILILTVGVMAVLTMVDRAALATGNTRVREGATSLAREVLEHSHDIAYPTLTGSAATALLGAQVSGASAGSGVYQVTRRNVTYSFTATACEVDDPSDGKGGATNNFCGVSGATSGSTVDPTAIQPVAVTVNVGGVTVPIAVGGSLVNTLCAMVGSNASLQSIIGGGSAALLAAAKTGADVRVCSGGGSQIAYDSQPDDYKRVSVTVSWPAGTGSGRPAGSVTQSTIIPAPGGGSTS